MAVLIDTVQCRPWEDCSRFLHSHFSNWRRRYSQDPTLRPNSPGQSRHKKMGGSLARTRQQPSEMGARTPRGANMQNKSLKNLDFQLLNVFKQVPEFWGSSACQSFMLRLSRHNVNTNKADLILLPADSILQQSSDSAHLEASKIT